MKSKLSDICSFADGRVAVADLDLGNYISTENMLPNKDGIIRSAGLPITSQTQAYQSGDVLVSNIRPYFRKIWIADRNGGCSNDVLVLRAKEGCNPTFLYYLLSDNSFFDYATATAKGTKMPRGDKGAIMRYEVPDVPLDIQGNIAQTLVCLDDKIANNKKINHHLEQMAQAIFKAWFVDFEPFGDSGFIESELGEIPTGWRVLTIGDVCDVKGGKRLPKGENLIAMPNNHPYIRVRDMNNAIYVQMNDSIEYVSDEIQRSISRFIVSTNDVIVSIVGTIGMVCKVHSSLDNANLTENCVKLTNLRGITPDFLYLFLSSSYGQETIKRGTVGAVQAKLPIKNIQTIQFVCPPANVMSDFDSIVNKTMAMIANNCAENHTLTTLRDTLLPRLMSGDLSIPDLGAVK